MIEVDVHRHSQSEEDCRNEDGIPSLEQSAPEREESEFCLDLLSSSSSSSDESAPNSVSDSPPNFMKTTTSSEARRNYFQKSPGNSSVSKTSKNLSRMSSSRFKSTLIRKSSDDRESQSSVSSRNSKLANRDNRQKIRDVSSVVSKSNSMISGIMLTRKPSLKPVRKLAKLAASKSKKRCNKEISEFPIESCAEKATCSSALKGSKFSENLELQPGEERESEKLAVKKICPYSYCSLHGHSHRNAPPLKRFKSIRKRALRAQKNKSESELPSRGKRSGNMKEGIRASKMVDGEGPVAKEMMNTDRLIPAAVEESDLSVIMDINSKEASDAKCEDNFDTGECILKDTLGSSDFDYEQMGCKSEASEKLKGDSTAEIDSLSRTSSSSSISLNITAEVQEINPKYIRMWQLVFKNVVDNTSDNADNELPLLQVKETSKEVGEKLLGETNSSSFKLLSSVDQEGTNVSTDTAAYRKLELFKKEAVKLVQEAFDRILLPEIQDQSPRFRDENLGEKLFERIRGEVRGPSLLAASSSTHSAGEEELAPDSEKTQNKVENITSMEEKKTMPRIENMPNQSAPKRWSNLKKLILLKRFVKALEKVRKINPQKPRYLPFNPEPEGENVHLQRQTTEERKNSEEWMLDYAIQQVISKLEPAQKKRVSLLIEAFETVLPPGVEAHIRTEVASPVDPYQVRGASDGADKESGRQNGAADTSLGKLLKEKSIVKESAVQANNITRVQHQKSMTFSNKNDENLEHLEKSEQDEAVHETTSRGWRVGKIAAHNLDELEQEATVKISHLKSVDICLPEVKDAILESETSKKPEDTSYQEVSANGKLFKISKRAISRLNSELLHNGYLEPDQTISKNDSLINVTGGEADTDTDKNLSLEEYETSEAAKSLTFEDHEKSTKVSNSDCSTSANELLEKTRAAIFDRSRTALSKAGSTQEESVSSEEITSSIGEANETQLEEKKNANMWFLIYKHMVSSTDDKDGSKALVDEETVKDEKDLSSRKQNVEMENRFVNDPAVELQCIEAVKLVNEAIDEIPLPDNSTSPHDQSFSADLIADQALSREEKRDACTVSDRRREAHDTIVSNLDEDTVKPVDVNDQKGEKELNFGKKPNQQVMKNWSNLKKVILLKRFIKAMEKVKKFNPRQPNFLPLLQDPESEKVQLRHQDSVDRKNAEEWMLDYALQQVVAKLTPARKRKVELLVQAFETVNPTIRK